MASWVLYTAAKRHLMDGSIDLDTDSFRMSLFSSASNAADIAGLTAIASVTGEVVEAFGYSSSGKPLVGVTWGQGASPAQMRFDCTAVTWGAAFGDIANVKYAVIWREGASAGARKLLCYTQLSAAQFSIPSGNTFTVVPSPDGIFVLN
jgi:hypothetical protein